MIFTRIKNKIEKGFQYFTILIEGYLALFWYFKHRTFATTHLTSVKDHVRYFMHDLKKSLLLVTKKLLVDAKL